MTVSEDEVKDFARKVERLCDFLLEKTTRGADREAIDKLGEQAANLQFSNITLGDIVIVGVAEVLR